MRIGSLKKMIGFLYKGQVNYINRIEDFRDFVEPSLYEAMLQAFENGCGNDDGIQKKYEELESDYEELESQYSSLEDEVDRLEELAEERDSAKEKYDTLVHCIEVLIAQYYQRYIKQDDLIPNLEKMVREAANFE